MADTPQPEPLDLDALDRLAAAASPGPWRRVGSELFYGPSAASYHNQIPREADAVFIATAREAVPALVAALRIARALESPVDAAVVWADAATPFTGEQVADLLRENERLRTALAASEQAVSEAT